VLPLTEENIFSYIYQLNLKNFFLHFFFVIPLCKVFKSYLASEIGGVKLSGKPSYISFILAVLIFLIAQIFLAMVYFSNNLLLVYFVTIFIPLFMMTPCLSWIRTCAEHRSFTYQSNSDVVCRNFKKNFLGFFLGAAGFRNHGLHHASPGLEYIKLDEKNLGIDSSNPPRDSYSSVIFRLIFP
jgi:fatty acid desaturase